MKTFFNLFIAVMVSLSQVEMVKGAIDEDSAKAKIVVTRAVFGSGLNVVDVTKRVAELLRSEADGFSARGDWLKVDPLPYKAKALAITYDYKGKHYLFVTASTQKVSYQLLLENAKKADEPAPSSAL